VKEKEWNDSVISTTVRNVQYKMVKRVQETWKEDTTMTFRDQNGQTVIGSISHDTQT